MNIFLLNLEELTHYNTMTTFEALKEKDFENIVGKGENAGSQHFLLFPQCFLTIPKIISVFKLHLFYCLQMLSIWESPKFCCVVQS